MNNADYGLSGRKDTLGQVYAKGYHSYKIDKPEMKRSKMFEKDALDSIVKRELNNVPQHHTIAMIAVANKDGERFAIAVKPNEEWEIQGYVEHKETGLSYGASVQWSR